MGTKMDITTNHTAAITWIRLSGNPKGCPETIQKQVQQDIVPNNRQIRQCWTHLNNQLAYTGPVYAVCSHRHTYVVQYTSRFQKSLRLPDTAYPSFFCNGWCLAARFCNRWSYRRRCRVRALVVMWFWGSYINKWNRCRSNITAPLQLPRQRTGKNVRLLYGFDLIPSELMMRTNDG